MKIRVFPVSALAAVTLFGCKPTPPPPSAAAPSPAPPVEKSGSADARPDRGPSAGPGQGRGEGPGRPDFARRSQERLERLRADLALTEDQVAKIREAFTQQMASMETQIDQSLDREQMRARMQEAREAVDARISEILTPEQRAKWEEQRKQRQAEMAERRAKREKTTPPPPPAQ